MAVRLAAQESMLEGETLPQKYEFALAHGFDGIELSGRGGGVFAGRRKELQQARSSGVVMPSAVVSIAHFVGDFDDAHRRAAIDDVKSLLETLPAAGAAGVVMPNTFGVFSKRLPPFQPPRSDEESRARLVEALAELGAYGQREGAKVFLEPLNRYEDYLVNTLQDAVSIVEAVDSPAIAVIADTFHMSIEEAHVGAAIQDAGPRIEHVQLGDSDRFEPGHGHYDWDDTLDALQAIGYDGWLAMECRLSGMPSKILPQVSQLLRHDG